MTPGQRMAHGTRQPPSQLVSFSLRKGVEPPSGQVMTSAPLSVEYITMVSFAMPSFVELVEERSDVPVVLHHAIGVEPQAGHALRLLLEMREHVHARRVPPDEERLALLVGALDELEARGEELLVDGLHPLGVQRASALDLLRAVRLGPAVEHAARPETLLEPGVLRIVGVLRLLLGVEVVEVPEELIEAVRGGQELVAVAQVFLAELAGDVAQGFQ